MLSDRRQALRHRPPPERSTVQGVFYPLQLNRTQRIPDQERGFSASQLLFATKRSATGDESE